MNVQNIFQNFEPNTVLLKPWEYVVFYTFLIFGCYVVEMIFSIDFWFLIDFRFENQPKNIQKSIPKAIENKMQVGMDFGWLFDRFLIDFGPKLEVKLGPSWHQNRKKWGTKTMSKIIKNLKTGGPQVVRKWSASKSGPGP